MNRLGEPIEIAKTVVFLALDDSSYITGIELFVDIGAGQILKCFFFFAVLTINFVLIKFYSLQIKVDDRLE
jgi:hypothetical protein